VSYMQFILTAAFRCLPSQNYTMSLVARTLLVGMGITYTTSILTGSYNIAFIPYQNYIAYSVMDWESDGQERNTEVIRRLTGR
jgi:hypothetical protein